MTDSYQGKKLSEDRLNQILEFLPVGVAVIEADGRVSYTNQIGKDLLLTTEIISPSNGEKQTTICQLYQYPTGLPYPEDQLPAARTLKGETLTLDDIEIHRETTTISLEVRSVPVFDHQGNITAALMAFHDISDRKRIEAEKQRAIEELRESEQRYATLAKASPVGIFRNDTEGNCLYANERSFEMIGLCPTETMGQGWIQSLHPEDRERTISTWYNFVQQGVPFACEYRFIKPDGSIIWVFGQAMPEKDAKGNLTGYIGTITDITAQKQTEATSRENETKFRRFADNVPGMIYRYVVYANGSDEFTYMSPGARSLYERDPEELMQNPKLPWQVTHPDDIPSLQESIYQSAQTLQPWRWEGRLVMPDGRIKWFQGISQPEKQENGDLVWDGLLIDINERKLAEAARIASETRLKTVLENTAALISSLHIDDSGTYKYDYISPRSEAILGFTDEDFLADSNLWLSRVHSEDLQAVQTAFKTTITQGNIAIEYRFHHKNGEQIWLLQTLIASRDENAHCWKISGVATDITDRKRAEIALRASESRFRRLTENLPGVIYRYQIANTGHQEFTYISPRCRELYEIEPEAVQQNPSILWQLIHPEDAPNLQQAAPLALQTLQPWSLEIRIITPSGYLKWLQVFASGEKQPNGDIVWDGFVIDISARKQAEKVLADYNRTLEQQVRQRTVALEQEISERKKAEEAAEAANQAKTRFLANMSHELRTPLNAILGFSQIIARSGNLSKENQENIRIIRRSGEHLLVLIDQVLDLSKIEAGTITINESNFDLYSLLSDVENMFSWKARDKKLQLKFQRSLEVPQYIRADKVKLRQVLINLLSNAVKFTEKGSVVVRLETVKFTSVSAQLLPHTQQQQIIFQVSDTGPGIEANEFDYLFKPFMQTLLGQKVQEGTGLGLTISYQFVRLMGGSITVSSRGKSYTPGADFCQIENNLGSSNYQGAIFRFNIPVSVVTAKEIEENQSQTCRAIGIAPNQPRYRMLVVDDSDFNRQLLLKVLKRLGFEVQGATDGAEALQIWETWQPKLIWMDMRMPGMDGYEATRRIKANSGDKRVVIIAISASALLEEKQAALAVGCDDFVGKPFREKDICQVILKHLGVSFIYEDRVNAADAIEPQPLPVLTPSDIAVLPKDWLQKLRQSVIEGDVEQMGKLIQQIRPEHEKLADALLALANQYQFEQLLNLIREK